MNNRHEQSRAAFEAEAESELNSTMKDSHGQYIAAVTSVMWEAWTSALDYAAEQQAAPTPLTRPDRPGWWWHFWNGMFGIALVWDVEDGQRAIEITSDGCAMEFAPTGFHSSGLWLPATPPPAPTQTTNQNEQ